MGKDRNEEMKKKAVKKNSAVVGRSKTNNKSRAKRVQEAKDDIKVTPVPKMESNLTPEEVEHFHEVLLQKRQELIGDMDTMKDGALNKSRSDASGDLSAMPIHMADIGSDNYEQEFTLNLIQSEQHLLKEIDEALKRISKGIYGVCMATGKPIDKERLKLKPWAKYSIEHVRKMEETKIREP